MRQVRARPPWRSGSIHPLPVKKGFSAVHSHKQRETLTNSKEFTTNLVVVLPLGPGEGWKVARAEGPIGCCRSFQADSPAESEKQVVCVSSLRKKAPELDVGTSTPGFRVFLLVVFSHCKRVPSLSEARGLHREVYIQPRPPLHRVGVGAWSE